MKDSKKNILNFKLILFSALLVIGSFLVIGGKAEASIGKQEIISLTNVERSNLGLETLVENPVLSEAAALKAADMAARGYFSHNTPDGKTPWSFMERAGYEYSSAGENLAVDFFDNEAVMRAWMKSPGHRANIVNSSYKEIGVAYQKGYYQGRETIFVVQMFGVPVGNSIYPSQNINQSIKVPEINIFDEVSIPTVVDDTLTVVPPSSPSVLSETKSRGIESKKNLSIPPSAKTLSNKKITENKKEEENVSTEVKELVSPIAVETPDTYTATVKPHRISAIKKWSNHLGLYFVKLGFWWRTLVFYN